MIIVKGSIPVNMDHHEEAVELVETLAENSRREPGCLAYEVYLRSDAPEVIVVWQQWTSMEALEAHFASRHVDEFLDRISDLVEGEVSSAWFDVHQADEPQHSAEEISGPPRVELAGNITLH